ncbi:MAG: radical SAM protein [Bacteroidetes bacterium]|nr:radical SAM protein [Bacteroidota bacterium]
MAGFSGSNGGISPNAIKIKNYNSFIKEFEKNLRVSFVDYFVNNQCNINCRHCYVNYKQDNGSIGLDDWIQVFSSLIENGARTFGNVGKEPLLSWELTRQLLSFFKNQSSIIPDIRFGIVTNGILLDENKIGQLIKLTPNYIDISVDGNKTIHEKIRGTGTYSPLYKNLELISSTSLKKNIWISFTLNKFNKDSLPSLINELYKIGYSKFLVSPFITLDTNDKLYLSDEEIVTYIEDFMCNDKINFNSYNNLNIYFKHDFITSGNIMFKLEKGGIINKNNLFVDDYGILYTKYDFTNNNNIFFNYIPMDISFKQIIRISHDGYISNCLDMFFEDYQNRAIGNILKSDILDILSDVNNKSLDNIFKAEETIF